MQNKIKRFFFCLFCLTFLAACRSPEMFELTDTDSGKTLDVRVGDRITVTLPSNPTTGYMWSYKNALPTDIVIPTGEKVNTTSASKELCGAPVTQSFYYKVIAPGTAGINLEYRRPWLKNEAPEATFSLLVKATGEAENPPPPPKTKTKIYTDSKGNKIER